MTTEKFKRDKPDIDVFDTDTDTKNEVITSPLQDTMESKNERRHLLSLKPATQVDANVFDQSDQAEMRRHITTDSAGILVKKRTGMVTSQEVHDQ